MQPGDVVVYCPDQLGPSVSRLLPAGTRQVAVPDGRLAAARRLGRLRRPQRLRLALGVRGHRLGARAGSDLARLAGGYRTLEGQCEALAEELADRRGDGRLVQAAVAEAEERAWLTRFLARR